MGVMDMGVAEQKVRNDTKFTDRKESENQDPLLLLLAWALLIVAHVRNAIKIYGQGGEGKNILGSTAARLGSNDKEPPAVVPQRFLESSIRLVLVAHQVPAP